MSNRSFFNRDYNLAPLASRHKRPKIRHVHWLGGLALIAGAGALYALAASEAGAERPVSAAQTAAPLDVLRSVSYSTAPLNLPGQRSGAHEAPAGGAGGTSTKGPVTRDEDRPAEPANETVAAPPVPADPTNGETASDEGPTPPAQGEWHTVTVNKGDSLARVFDRRGLSPRTLHTIMQLDGAQPLKRIHPGDQLRLLTEGEQLNGLAYELDATRTLQVRRSGDEGFSTTVAERPVEIRQAFATGEIDTSLFLAARQAGLTDRMTMELASIFAWDIDFVLDIRGGDRFSVLYEEYYLDGEKLRNGDILAAEFINQGERHRAVRFEAGNGKISYYTPKGRNVQKAFLRTPVAFTRISSRFSRGRHHPILNRIRAHKGVDYAAPRGTPIKATGEGKVVLRGRKGGYGNCVVLRHGGRYSTLYGHMARFTRGLRHGDWVKQGEVIGYVGASGLATGPHLHYEFRVNGVHRNPLTVDLPTAEPIDERYRAEFQKVAERRLSRLETIKRTQLASN